MGNLTDKIFKQHAIGQTWGRFALAGSQIAVLVSTYTMLMVTINAYAPISEWLIHHGIYLRFWMLITVLLVPMIVAYFLAWKFLVVSFYRSSVDQFMAQNKELTDELAKIEDIKRMLVSEFTEVKKRLEVLEKR